MKANRRTRVRRAEDRFLRDLVEREAGGSRREGDERAWTQRYPLTFRPNWHEPFRWLPKHGEPLCVAEWVSQSVYRNRLMLYVAVVVTLTLLVAVVGVDWIPFLEAK